MILKIWVGKKPFNQRLTKQQPLVKYAEVKEKQLKIEAMQDKNNKVERGLFAGMCGDDERLKLTDIRIHIRTPSKIDRATRESTRKTGRRTLYYILNLNTALTYHNILI